MFFYLEHHFIDKYLYQNINDHWSTNIKNDFKKKIHDRLKKNL